MEIIAKIKNKKIIVSTIVGIVVVGLIGGYFLFFRAKGAEAEWFNDEWYYRKVVNITNAGTTQTDFQVAITLDTATLYSAGKIQSDCDDIRITDKLGKLLPYWIETGTNACNTATTAIWVKVPSIPTTGQTVYVYYGNPNAASYQNGDNTFEFFDDFESGNLNKWPTISGNVTNSADYAYGGTRSIKLVSTAASVDSYARVSITDQNLVATARFRDNAAINPADGKMGLYYGADYRALLGVRSTPTYYRDAYYNSSWQTPSTQVTRTTGWHKLDIVINGTSVEFYVDSTLIHSATMAASGVNLFNLNAYLDWSFTIYFDDVRIRKYSSPEPTVGSPGTEQQGPGPVAYWRFDEGYGDTTYDDSTNNNDGTRGGGTPDYKPTWQTEDMCVSGKCLRFDGSNDYVDAGNDVSLRISSNITVEAWIKLNTTPAGYDMIARKESGPPYLGYVLYFNVNTTAPYFEIYSSASVGAAAGWATGIGLGDWHHVVGTYDGLAIRMYVDGDLKNTNPKVGDIGIATTNLVIGGVPGHYTDGSIDDVRIYNYARSAAQVKADYLSRGASEGVSAKIGNESAWISNGLVGYWKMDEASWTNDCVATSVTDSSGAGNNGKSCPNGTGPTGGAAGKFGNGGLFDGTEDYVSVPDSSGFPSGTNNFTVETWVKADTVSGGGGGNNDHVGLIQQQDGGGSQPKWYFYIHWVSSSTGKLSFHAHNAALTLSTDQSGDTKTFTDGWHQVGITRDGNNYTFWFDGATAGNFSWTEILSNPVSDLTMGLGADHTVPEFDGLIDDVRIYNRALSAKEVRDLYNWAPGPVGYWTMDEKVSGNSQTIYDRSTYGNNGTTYWGTNVSGMDCRIPGKYGTACQFDGVDDYVNAGTGASLNITNAITIEAWVQRTAWQGGVSYQAMLMKGSTNTAYQIRRNASEDTLLCDMYINGVLRQVVSSQSLPVGTWQHVVCTFDGSTIKFYQNAGTPSTLSVTGTIGTSSNLRIGCEEGIQRYWPGTIDDVRIYNYARTQKQIMEDMNAGHPSVGSPVGSYVGYWKFDEGYSNIAYDMSGNNNDGTLQPGAGGGNTQAYQMWDNNGKFGKAIEFDGDDYVSVTDPGSGWVLDITSGITIGAWVKTSVAGTYKEIVGKNATGDGYQDPYLLRIDATFNTAYGRIGNGSANRDIMGTTVVTDNNWHHLIFKYDDSYLYLFVDGKSDATPVSKTITPLANDTNLMIGKNMVSLYFNGLIDEVKIYPFALTQDEIKTEYNKGAAIKLGSVSTASDGSTASDAASRGYCVPGDATSCSAPVGEWKFDEKVSGTGQTVYDTSGNGNNGTTNWGGNASGMDCSKPGKLGSACQFDGTDDYVNAGSSESLKLASAVTMEAWINTNVALPSVNKGIISKAKYVSGLDSLGYMIRQLTNGYIQTAVFNNHGGTAAQSTTVLTVGKWYHVVGTYDGSYVRLYVNGVLEGTSGLWTGGIRTSDDYLCVGCDYRDPNWNGLIDDVRIYNYARTPAQIAWDYNRGKPVGWWKFDECQGGTAYDMSDNNNDGAITIGATGSQDGIGTCTDGDTTNAWYNGRTGKYNSAMSFDGTDDYVDVGNPASLNFGTGDLSVELWAKLTPVGAGTLYHGLVAKSDGPLFNWYAIGWELFYSTGDLLFQINDGGADTGVTVSYGYDIDDNNWHHIVAVADRDGTGKIYLDGNLVASANFTGASGSISGSWSAYIGRAYTSYGAGEWRYSGGFLDEVKIYNYALTADQIQTDYNQGAAVRFGPATGNP